MIDNNFTILNENVRNVSISGLQNFTGNSMNLRSVQYINIFSLIMLSWVKCQPFE